MPASASRRKPMICSSVNRFFTSNLLQMGDWTPNLGATQNRGDVDAARRFSAVTLCAWPLMVGLFATAIANTRRPQIHKRVMTLLMAAMMTPAIARVFLTFLAPAGAAAGGPPPPFVSIPPGLMADL